MSIGLAQGCLTRWFRNGCRHRSATGGRTTRPGCRTGSVRNTILRRGPSRLRWQHHAEARPSPCPQAAQETSLGSGARHREPAGDTRAGHGRSLRCQVTPSTFESPSRQPRSYQACGRFGFHAGRLQLTLRRAAPVRRSSAETATLLRRREPADRPRGVRTAAAERPDGGEERFECGRRKREL